MFATQNLHVKAAVRLLTPRALKADLPMTEAANRTVVDGRRRVTRILEQQDSRLLVVVGPCSIHDTKAALEYAGGRPPRDRNETEGTVNVKRKDRTASEARNRFERVARAIQERARRLEILDRLEEGAAITA